MFDNNFGKIVDRFSKFFHQPIREKILYVPTQRLPSAICCYYTTLWIRKSKNVTDFDSILNELLTYSWGHSEHLI